MPSQLVDIVYWVSNANCLYLNFRDGSAWRTMCNNQTNQKRDTWNESRRTREIRRSIRSLYPIHSTCRTAVTKIGIAAWQMSKLYLYTFKWTFQSQSQRLLYCYFKQWAIHNPDITRTVFIRLLKLCNKCWSYWSLNYCDELLPVWVE